METKNLNLHTVREVAEMLKLTQWAVASYIRNGKIPAFKFGKEYRIKDDDLQVFLTQTYRTATGGA